MKSILLFLFFLIGGISAAVAETAEWQYQTGFPNPDLRKINANATVTVEQKTYPVKLTFFCTQDKESGALGVDITLPENVSNYIPMDVIEGPDAAKSMPANIIANSQAQKKAFQMRALTSVYWSGDDGKKIVFSISEPYSEHKQFYHLLHYLSDGADDFEVTLSNPQKNKPNLLIKADAKAGRVAMLYLIKNCGLSI